VFEETIVCSQVNISNKFTRLLKSKYSRPAGVTAAVWRKRFTIGSHACQGAQARQASSLMAFIGVSLSETVHLTRNAGYSPSPFT
jgi:hypothetical protein